MVAPEGLGSFVVLVARSRDALDTSHTCGNARRAFCCDSFSLSYLHADFVSESQVKRDVVHTKPYSAPLSLAVMRAPHAASVYFRHFVVSLTRCALERSGGIDPALEKALAQRRSASSFDTQHRYTRAVRNRTSLGVGGTHTGLPGMCVCHVRRSRWPDASRELWPITFNPPPAVRVTCCRRRSDTVASASRGRRHRRVTQSHEEKARYLPILLSLASLYTLCGLSRRRAVAEGVARPDDECVAPACRIGK